MSCSCHAKIVLSLVPGIYGIEILIICKFEKNRIVRSRDYFNEITTKRVYAPDRAPYQQKGQ